LIGAAAYFGLSYETRGFYYDWSIEMLIFFEKMFDGKRNIEVSRVMISCGIEWRVSWMERNIPLNRFRKRAYLFWL
jgi:hypothetical protein